MTEKSAFHHDESSEVRSATTLQKYVSIPADNALAVIIGFAMFSTVGIPIGSSSTLPIAQLTVISLVALYLLGFKRIVLVNKNSIMDICVLASFGWITLTFLANFLFDQSAFSTAGPRLRSYLTTCFFLPPIIPAGTCWPRKS